MARDPATLPAPARTLSLRPGHRSHVLLVEDEPGIADFVTRALHGQGYVVAHVFDGPLGLRLAEDGIFDLIILDWRIPGETGSKVLDAISNSSAGLPIIVTSAGDEAAECLVRACANPVRFIAKPFAMKDLLSIMRELLSTGDSGPAVEPGPGRATPYRARDIAR